MYQTIILMYQISTNKLNLRIDHNLHKDIIWQLQRHSKQFDWKIPVNPNDILSVDLLIQDKNGGDFLSKSLIQRNTSSIFQKLYISLISKKAMKDFNSHNKFASSGFIYGKNDIIEGCKNIHKTGLSGRILSVVYKHIHNGFMQPNIMSKLGIANTGMCKLCGDTSEATYLHISFDCPITDIIRTLLKERLFRATNKHLPLHLNMINILNPQAPHLSNNLINLSLKTVCAYKFCLHKHFHSGLANTEIENPRLPLSLTNKILNIVNKSEQGKFKLLPFKKWPHYLSFCKKKTPPLENTLSEYYRTDNFCKILNVDNRSFISSETPTNSHVLLLWD